MAGPQAELGQSASERKPDDMNEDELKLQMARLHILHGDKTGDRDWLIKAASTTESFG